MITRHRLLWTYICIVCCVGSIVLIGQFVGSMGRDQEVLCRPMPPGFVLEVSTHENYRATRQLMNIYSTCIMPLGHPSEWTTEVEARNRAWRQFEYEKSLLAETWNQHTNQ